MINIACWNVRGLNSPLRQKEIRTFIQKKEHWTHRTCRSQSEGE